MEAIHFACKPLRWPNHGPRLRIRLRARFCSLVAIALLCSLVAPPVNANERATIQPDLSELGQAVAFDHNQTVPRFPRKLKGYRLQGKPRRYETRLFQGNRWEPLRPVAQSTNSCGYYFWIVRWRTRNPEMLLLASVGDTAIPPHRFGKPLVAPAIGGAGWISGRSCVAPGLKFAGTLNGNPGNLTDVDYEIQIWEPRPII